MTSIYVLYETNICKTIRVKEWMSVDKTINIKGRAGYAGQSIVELKIQ